MKKICYISTIGETIHAFFVPQLNYLSNNGYAICVICSDGHPDLKKELDNKIRYIPVEIPRGISLIKMIMAIRKLCLVFKNEKFDMIQYSTPNASFCASIAGKRIGIKIRNYHLMGFRYLGASGVLWHVLKTIEKITCKNSTSIECVSKSNLKFGIQEGIFTADNSCVVWNGSSGGVDLRRFDSRKRDEWRRETRTELKLFEDYYVFGFVGRITKDKGIYELLEAFLNIKGKAKLVIIGNMEDPVFLNSEIYKRAKQSSDIIFHEYSKDIERYYAAMDVLVLPSYREGFGMVIAEAAAMGTPAIVSDIPGPVDVIVKGKTAVTVPPKNVKELENVMRRFISGETKLKSEDCAEYIRETFEQDKLCEKIYERKKELLAEYE